MYVSHLFILSIKMCFIIGLLCEAIGEVTDMFVFYFNVSVSVRVKYMQYGTSPLRFPSGFQK